MQGQCIRECDSLSAVAAAVAWGGVGVGMQSELGHCGDGEEGEILRIGYW